jgi:hypothetical protein
MAATKSTLQDDYDEALKDLAEVKSLLSDAYESESSREDLAVAVGKARDILEDYEDEDEDTDDDDTDGVN